VPVSKTLRVEFGNDGQLNEYRITDEGRVQYRVLYGAAGGWSRWLDLTDNDIACHFGFNTVVAEWLRHRVVQSVGEAGRAA
jgi:hypothetical protein